MAKDKRASHDKYWLSGGATAAAILKTLCPTIGQLITDLENALAPYEEMDVHRWVGDWYYVVVKDWRLKNYPEDSRIGFTFNIKRDIIMWNNDPEDNLSGGNCFLRSAKWKAFVNKRFNGEVTEEMMYFYTFVYPPKPEPIPDDEK